MNNGRGQPSAWGRVVAGPGESSGALSRLSLTELEQAYVESLQAAETSDHVGRHNRLVGRCNEIAQELKARGEARSVLTRLADHPNAKVRAWASGNLDYNKFNNTFGPYGAFEVSSSGIEQQVYVMTASALAAATP